MPPDMAINMRHSKLKASEAALLAGELKKPTWESRNEGIHERVSFEDAIWGFDLAGGSYYKTPLRVVSVKKDSRAEKAGIRPGDRLKRINDIDTSTLTIQEAHKIIIDSGIHLKIAVTAPEDEEDAYFCYQDQIEDGYDSEEERRLEEEKAKKREVHAKVSSYWSLKWPWVSKRRIIYRESNCFMVPSKYEKNHELDFPAQPVVKKEDDIVLESIQSKPEENNETRSTPVDNNYPYPYELANNKLPIINGTPDTKTTSMVNGNKKTAPLLNGHLEGLPEVDEPSQSEDMSSLKEDLTEDMSQNDEITESKDEITREEISVDESNVESENVEPSSEHNIDNSQSEIIDEQSEEVLSEELQSNEEIIDEIPEPTSENIDNSQSEVLDENSVEVLSEEQSNDELIDEILESSSATKVDEENIIDSILSDSEEPKTNSHSDER